MVQIVEVTFLLFGRCYTSRHYILSVESLFTMDLAYLQDLYQRINSMEIPTYHGICPHCGKEIDVPINFMEAG